MLFLAVIVVFLEPFRVDESFYIYRSKLDLTENGLFDLLVAVLQGWFCIFRDYQSSILSLRLLTFLCFIGTITSAYLVFSRVLVCSPGGKSPIWILSFTFGAWLAMNRGFEIRPEHLANLFYMLATLLALTKGGARGRKISSIGIAVLLFIPTLFNFRYWPLSFGVFLSLAGLENRQGDSLRIRLLPIVIHTCGFIAATLLLHLAFFDLPRRLDVALNWTTSQGNALDVFEKILFDVSNVAMPAYTIMWVLIILYLCKATYDAAHGSHLVEYLVAIAPLAAFYLFFFMYEMRPFRYVRTVEAVAVFCSIVPAIKLGVLRVPIPITNGLRLSIIVASLVVIYTAVLDLGSRYHYVLDLYLESTQRGAEIEDIDQMYAPGSLYSQVAARTKFCSSPGQIAVLISSPNGHPFCGKDMGSLYNTWFLKYPESMRFSGLKKNSLPILISKDLTRDVSLRRYKCIPAGRYYSTCVRSSGKKDGKRRSGERSKSGRTVPE
ncbi:MAG: hypothetical protein PHU25_04005 [Deltaproteobacteria bacterium]|nr:hypothetical protein [Deltaproteobacteria bacterium]